MLPLCSSPDPGSPEIEHLLGETHRNVIEVRLAPRYVAVFIVSHSFSRLLKVCYVSKPLGVVRLHIYLYMFTNTFHAPSYCRCFKLIVSRRMGYVFRVVLDNIL